MRWGLLTSMVCAGSVATQTVAAPAAAGPVPTAQPDQIRRGPAPAWVMPTSPLPVPANASGAVFVRRQDVVVHLDAKGQSQFLGYRIKLLQPSALELGNVAISWNPAAGTPTVHDIKVYRDGAVTDVLAGTSFDILRREDQLEAAKLSGVLTAVLRVPDLRVGDEIEIAMTIPDNDPTLGNVGAGVLRLSPEPAAGRYRLALSWDASHKTAFRITPDMAAAAHRGDHAVELTFDNPAIEAPPKDAPPRYFVAAGGGI